MKHSPTAFFESVAEGRRVVVTDGEGNGLLPEVTKLHCTVAIDVKTREVFQWRPWQMDECIEWFNDEVDTAIGHNWLDYDVRAMEKLYPKFRRPRRIFDTLIAIRVVRPADTLIGPDIQLRNRGILPPQLIKGHSLKAWGIRLSDRLGKDVLKDEYDQGWEVWNEDMQSYMVQDGWSNVALWEYICEQVGWWNGDGPQPAPAYTWPVVVFDTEMDIQRLMLDQTDHGIAFDRAEAIQLSRELTNEKHRLEGDIGDYFKGWWAPLDDPQMGRVSERAVNRKRPDLGVEITVPRSGKGGRPLKPYVGPPIETTEAGAPFCRIERITFKPGSRDHLGQRLQAQFGWKPKRFGKNKKPTVDEAVLSEIPETVLPPELRDMLKAFFTTEKVLGMLSHGRQAWLALSEEDSRLHPRMDTAGAITGRGTHRRPNVTTFPAVITEKDAAGVEHVVMGINGGFGYECRELVTCTRKIDSESVFEEITGTDMSSLELILAGHYAYPYDDGELSARVSDPKRDAHTEHAALTELPRRDTKTVTYLWLFGGGAGRAGEEVTFSGPEEIEELLRYKSLPMLLRNKAEREGTDFVMPDKIGLARLAKGHIIIKRFEQKIPVFKQVKQAVMEAAEARGFLLGIDGRKLFVRKPYAAVSTLIQGSGSEACKVWINRTHVRLAQEGLTLWRDYAPLIWAHDEQQFEHVKGLGPIIGKASLEAAYETSDILHLKGRFRSEAKTGLNWAQTH